MAIKKSRKKTAKSEESNVPVKRARTAVPVKKEATATVPERRSWDPFRELRPVREIWEDLESMRPHPWPAWPSNLLREWPRFQGMRSLSGEKVTPSTDVYRENNDLVVKADLPGMKKTDVEVKVEDGYLVVSGERKHEETKEERDYYRSERSYGSFYRRVPLPEGTDPDAVTAKCDDGVLEVHVPLLEGAEEGAKRIHVD